MLCQVCAVENSLTSLTPFLFTLCLQAMGDVYAFYLNTSRPANTKEISLHHSTVPCESCCIGNQALLIQHTVLNDVTTMCFRTVLMDMVLLLLFF